MYVKVPGSHLPHARKPTKPFLVKSRSVQKLPVVELLHDSSQWTREQCGRKGMTSGSKQDCTDQAFTAPLAYHVVTACPVLSTGRDQAAPEQQLMSFLTLGERS